MQRVDLIAPEFHAHRLLHVRRKQVHDVAPHRKLAGAVHLHPPGVACAEQQRHQLLPGDTVTGVQRAGIFAEFLPRGGELGQALAGHADRLQAAAHQIAQHRQTAVFVFPGGALDGAQQVVPRREHRRSHPQRIQVSGKAGGLRLAGSDKAERPPCLRGQRRIHQRTPRRRQAKESTGPVPLQGRGQCFVFLCLFKQCSEHNSSRKFPGGRLFHQLAVRYCLVSQP